MLTEAQISGLKIGDTVFECLVIEAHSAEPMHIEYRPARIIEKRGNETTVEVSFSNGTQTRAMSRFSMGGYFMSKIEAVKSVRRRMQTLLETQQLDVKNTQQFLKTLNKTVRDLS